MSSKEFEQKTRKALTENPQDVRDIDYHLSACYLLQSCAQMHLDYANGILKKYGLLAWDLKHHSNAIDLAFDKFYKTMHAQIDKANRELFTADLLRLYDEIDELLKK